jgi:LEA14-like dessication related protein
LIAALTLLPAAGCAGVIGPSLTPPAVSIDDVGLSRPGLASQDLMLTLAFRNRMARDLTIESVSFDLEVNGDLVGNGLLLKDLVLPGAGAVSVDVPVKIRTADLIDALVRLGQTQELSYSLDGRLALGGKDAGRTLCFEDDGALALPGSLSTGRTL